MGATQPDGIGALSDLTAPASIQTRRVAIWAAVRGSPEAGMMPPRCPEPFSISRLAPLAPGTIDGPLAPPASINARLVSDSPAAAFTPLWQGAQRAARMGCTSLAKSTA